MPTNGGDTSSFLRYKSPLRYPGGKARLAPFVQSLFERNGLCDGHYAEPYAGGASVALSMLLNEYARHVHINDLDRSVYAFWSTALSRTDEMCRLVNDAPLTPKEWARQRAIQNNKSDVDDLELGFSTFYLNRTSRSGIVCSSGMIGGKKQGGKWKLDARFNRAELIKRINRIASYRDRITVTQLDANLFLRKMSRTLPSKSLTYLDPPYYVKGTRRLYASYYAGRDHATIARQLDSYGLPWLVSYDYAPEILTLYQKYRCVVYNLPYTAARRYDGAEAMFFSPSLQPTNMLPATRPVSAKPLHTSSHGRGYSDDSAPR